MRSLLLKKDLYFSVVQGLKTETRRTNGLQEINKDPLRWQLESWGHMDGQPMRATLVDRLGGGSRTVKSKYKIGEELYLAEPIWVPKNRTSDQAPIYEYDIAAGADREFSEHFKKLSPMFLSADQGREFVRVRSVELERLTQISEESAELEGVPVGQRAVDPDEPNICIHCRQHRARHEHWKSLACFGHSTTFSNLTYKGGFKFLWESINGRGSWDVNPWVWVYCLEYLKDKSRR